MSSYAETVQNTINAIDAAQDAALSRIKAAYQRVVALLQDQRDAAIQLVSDLTAQTNLTTEARNILDNFVATIQANTAQAESEAESAESTATSEESTGVVGSTANPTSDMTQEEIDYVRSRKSAGVAYNQTAADFAAKFSGKTLTQAQYDAITLPQSESPAPPAQPAEPTVEN